MSKVKNETVYVIYRNGKPYENSSRKIAYVSLGAANGVISADSASEARTNYETIRRESRYTIKEWYYLSEEEQNKFVEKVKSQFEIVEYGPKKEAEELKRLNDVLFNTLKLNGKTDEDIMRGDF